MAQQTAVDKLIQQMDLETVCKYSNELAEAKEMEQRMYSEEEVLDLIQSLSMNIEFSSVHVRTARYFLEQYKNKL